MPKTNEREMSIIDFIGHQEQNLIGGIINLQKDLWFAAELDELYRYLMTWHRIHKSKELLITALFLDAHKSYYNSMLNFLRNSSSVALMSARRAIDSALTAYHLCIHPEDQPFFSNRSHQRYKEVFWNIKKYIKSKPNEYPIARGLISVHELASKWASHGTVEALMHDLEIEKPTKEKDGTLLLNYSEVLEYRDKYMKYYFFFIYVYHANHTIFWKEFFEKKFDIKNPEYEKKMSNFKLRLEPMFQKYSLDKA